MITTTDIGDILYGICKACFSIADVYRGGNIPDGGITTERIVIHPKPQTQRKIWDKSFTEVNLVVPDTPSGNADLARLGQLERSARKVLNGAGSYDGVTYQFSVSQTNILEDKQFRCHFVNVKVLFKSMNIVE